MKTIKVKRLTQGCCGMKHGETYEAYMDIPQYVWVILPSGEVLAEHWVKDHFEILTEGGKDE